MTLRYLLENLVDPECFINLYVNGRLEMFYKAGMLLKNMRKSALDNTVTKIAPHKDLKNILEIHIETKGVNQNKKHARKRMIIVCVDTDNADASKQKKEGEA